MGDQLSRSQKHSANVVATLFEMGLCGLHVCNSYSICQEINSHIPKKGAKRPRVLNVTFTLNYFSDLVSRDPDPGVEEGCGIYWSSL